MNTDPRIDAYIKSLPQGRQGAVRALRALLAESLPTAYEDIGYGMPALRISDDDIVCSYKSQKQYISLYLDADELEARRSEFGHLNCGRSCVRFRRFEDLPADAISHIVRATADRQARAAAGVLRH